MKRVLLVRKLGFIFTAAVLLTVFSAVYSDAASVTVKSAAGSINAKQVNVRSDASTKSSVVMKLKDNTPVTILSELFTSPDGKRADVCWYRIKAKGKTGYVRASRVDGIRYFTVQGLTRTRVNYRSGPSISCHRYGALSSGKNVTVYMKAKMRGSSSVWYQIRVRGRIRYVIATRVTGRNSFEAGLIRQGFPESYRKKLIKLHKKHPNWVFKADKTNLSFNTVLTRETRDGVSLVYKSYPKSYRDRSSKSYRNGRYIAKDGSSWYNASKKVVAYYIDPRNFLNEDRIYMFESLSYHSYQSKSAVRNVISGTALIRYGFTANMFYNAGKKYKISPIFLASRARQENGSGSIALRGYTILGKKTYNPFNIGAFSGSNPVLNGLRYARLKGWTTKTRSVNGAAKYLAGQYVTNRQNTMYLQRFNVRNGKLRVATHQYMTNTMAAYSEAYMTKTAYMKYHLTGKAIVFHIPVYTGMPSRTKLPK